MWVNIAFAVDAASHISIAKVDCQSKQQPAGSVSGEPAGKI
jgi:hypothetical protein